MIGGIISPVHDSYGKQVGSSFAPSRPPPPFLPQWLLWERQTTRCHVCSDSWKSKGPGSRRPASHAGATVRPERGVLGISWEEQLPATRQPLPGPGSVQTH